MSSWDPMKAYQDEIDSADRMIETYKQGIKEQRAHKRKYVNKLKKEKAKHD